MSSEADSFSGLYEIMLVSRKEKFHIHVHNHKTSPLDSLLKRPIPLQIITT